MKRCHWKCGRQTKNNTGISDECWKERESIYQARKAKEAAALPNPKRQAASMKAVRARRGEFNAELPATGLFEVMATFNP